MSAENKPHAESDGRAMLRVSKETPLGLLVNAAVTQLLDGGENSVDPHMACGTSVGDFIAHIHVCVKRHAAPTVN